MRDLRLLATDVDGGQREHSDKHKDAGNERSRGYDGTVCPGDEFKIVLGVHGASFL